MVSGRLYVTLASFGFVLFLQEFYKNLVTKTEHDQDNRSSPFLTVWEGLYGIQRTGSLHPAGTVL